jgi:transposase-like protein
VVTVGADGGEVERRLAGGELACPGCGGRLACWGWARTRQIRDHGGLVVLRPRRTRCVGCGATHVLLPVTALLRRADTASVIVSALVMAATRGVGFRRIAEKLARPAETVRGWLRRFGGRVEAVRSVFTIWLRALQVDPVMPGPAGGGVADAVAVIAGVADAAARRFGLLTVSVVEVAVTVSGGRLLSPGWPAAGCNTS